MIVDAASACLTLLPGQVSRLHLRAGTRLRGVRGSAWLTADGDDRDVVLDPQEEWVLERDQRVLACALRADGQAVLSVQEPLATPAAAAASAAALARLAPARRLPLWPLLQRAVRP